MIKRIFTAVIVMAAIAAIPAAAQTAVSSTSADRQATTRIVRGAVIDKNGNPIPGATVRATGGAEMTVTDADGTYSIEVPVWLKSLTASYDGMMDKKLKLTPAGTTIFTLKPERGQTYGFINLVGTQVWQVKSSIKGVPAQTQLGLMGGAYRNWGGYLKVVVKLPGGDLKYDNMYDRAFNYEPTVTFGAIKRLSKNFNILFGAGIAFNYSVYGWEYDYDYSAYDAACYQYWNKYDAWQNSGSIGSAPQEPDLQDFHLDKPVWTPEDAETLLTGALELGAMYHIGKFNVTGGITYIFPGESPSYTNNRGNLSGWLGIGYHF